MPLETILQAIDAAAEGEVEAIRQAAQAEVAQIQANAQAQADAIRQKHHQAVQAPLKAEQTRLINQAKLKALQLVLGAREELLAATLAAAAQQLADFSHSAAYPEALKRLALEAATALGPAQPLHFLAQPADAPQLAQAVAELQLNATVTADEAALGAGSLGGLIAATADRRISVINTLEVRLQQAAARHRAQLAGWVFGAAEER